MAEGFGDIIEITARLPAPIVMTARLPKGPVNDWLLLTGEWDDAGAWRDYAVWED